MSSLCGDLYSIIFHYLDNKSKNAWSQTCRFFYIIFDRHVEPQYSDLIRAIKNQHQTAALWLLSRPSILQDDLGHNHSYVLSLACVKHQISVVQQLLKHPTVDPMAEQCQALRLSIAMSHADLVRILLQDGRHVLLFEPNGEFNESCKQWIASYLWYDHSTDTLPALCYMICMSRYDKETTDVLFQHARDECIQWRQKDEQECRKRYRHLFTQMMGRSFMSKAWELIQQDGEWIMPIEETYQSRIIKYLIEHDLREELETFIKRYNPSIVLNRSYASLLCDIKEPYMHLLYKYATSVDTQNVRFCKYLVENQTGQNVVALEYLLKHDAKFNPAMNNNILIYYARQFRRWDVIRLLIRDERVRSTLKPDDLRFYDMFL